MFWTDWGKHPKIERANYDGSDRKAVISNFIKDINAVALDVASKYSVCLFVCLPACLPV